MIGGEDEIAVKPKEMKVVRMVGTQDAGAELQEYFSLRKWNFVCGGGAKRGRDCCKFSKIDRYGQTNIYWNRTESKNTKFLT